MTGQFLPPVPPRRPAWRPSREPVVGPSKKAKLVADSRVEPVGKVGKHQGDGLPIMLRPASKIPASGCVIGKGTTVVGRLNSDGSTEFYADGNGRQLGGISEHTEFKAVTDGSGNVQAIFVAPKP